MKSFTKYSFFTMWFYRISMLTICLASAAVLYIFYLIFFPSDIIRIQQPLLVVSGKVHGGEMVHVKANYCKKIKAISVIVRSLISVDDKNYVIPFVILSSNAPVGCGTIFIDTLIPQNIPPGKYKLLLSFQYQANAVRIIYEDFETQSFQIVQ